MKLPDYRKTYCNPLPIPDIYRAEETWAVMKFTGEPITDYRSISDPSVLYLDGKWYLYTSYGMSWVSEDFIHWEHHHTDPYNNNHRPNYSPCVVPFHGRYLMTSHTNGLYIGDSPLGPFELLGSFVKLDGSEFCPADTVLFLDDDGRLYMYFCQCSEGTHKRSFMTGTYAAELDANNPTHLKTDIICIHQFNPDNEWERFGEKRQDTCLGWIEGQWMYKKNGRYYLIYAAAGTEYSSYCMGCYYSDESPMSGFKLQKNNPIIENNKGLIRGSGHGCVTEGPNNTLWAFYTVSLAYTHIYERRIGMDLLSINEDGEIYCPHGVTDTPQWAPGVAPDPVKSNDAGLYALTCRQRGMCRASSFVYGHEPFYALDENMQTFWEPEACDEKPTFEVELQAPYLASAFRVMWKDLGLDYEKGHVPTPMKYIIEGCPDIDKPDEWVTLYDASQNEIELNIDYRTFDTVSIERVRLTVLKWPDGMRPAVIDFTVFGVRDESL